MNVRVVGTEVFVITIIILSFFNVFLDFPFGIYARIGLFVVFTLLGYFLIRSLIQESIQKENLRTLNSSLSQKVAEQTAEIREAYEIEKKARRDLEKLNDGKNQFIMITQHHLRAPTTTIDWELESMLSGAYGPINEELRTAATDARTAAKRLTHIIDDFLNIAALKVGGSILNLSSKSLKPAITDILDELKLDIEHLHITVNYPRNAADWPEISLDHEKMREILLIIMENAVRYNRPGGSIDISTRTHDNQFEITIENTGMGITAEESEKIGSALFYRGHSARTINPTGMGIGLSVAKAIVAAHHGMFSIRSGGKEKGAKVVIELPLKQTFEEY